MEPKRRPTGLAVIAWYGLVILLALAGLVGLAVSLAPYPELKKMFDRLATDGNFERFTVETDQAAQVPLLIAGGLLLLVCLLAVWKSQDSQRMVASGLRTIQGAVVRLRHDLRSLFAGAGQAVPPTWELLVLLVIVGFGLAGRLAFLQKWIEYDEGYTYIEFARHSIRHIISDYHHPNNHVFHTLLVHLSTRMFGGAVWAVRLPAFLAGVLILPAVYLLGRRLYQPWIGLAAAGLLAAAPVMILYSVNARGYTLITLFTLLLLILADVVRDQKNLAAWALMVLITGLGFYTIPTMLYPFGIVFSWLFLSGLLGEMSDSYGRWRVWPRYLVGYGVLSALLSIFFYIPIFRTRGPLGLFNNDSLLRPLSLAEFLSTLLPRLAGMVNDWFPGGLPAWLTPMLLVGMALSILLHQRFRRGRVNILLAALLFVIPALLIQRPQLPPRVWFFSIPLLALTGLAGWYALLERFPWPKQARGWIPDAAAVLILAAALWGGGRFLAPYWQDPARINFDTADSAAQVTRFIRDTLRDGDMVVVTPLYDGRFWFYFDNYQIPQRHIRDIKRQHFTRVLVIAADFQDLSVADIVQAYGPDLGFLRMDTVQEVYRAGDFRVYQIAPNQDLVDQAFGLSPETK